MAILIFISALWGTSFILIKRGLKSFTPVQLGTFRMFFAFVVLLPFMAKEIGKLKKYNLKSLLIVAFIGNLFPALLFALAQTKVSSSMAGMLNALFPITTLIAGIWLYGAKTNKKSLIGIIIGLLGSIILVFSDNSGSYNNDWLYIGFIIIAIIFYAISVNEIKYRLSNLNGKTVTILTFLFAGPASAIILLFTDLHTSFSQPDALAGISYIFMLSIFSSVIALLLFYILVQHVSPMFSASSTYIIPIFAALWGLADGEHISLLQGFSAIIILIGVYLTTTR